MEYSLKDQQYMFAYLVHEPETSEFVPWPLHITLVPWFVPKDGIDELLQASEAAIQEIEPFEAVVGGVKRFGHRRADTVEPNETLQYLHERLLAVVEGSAAITAPFKFVRNRYNPHITHSRGFRMMTGDRLLIDKVHCIRTDKTLNSFNRRKFIQAVLSL